MFHNYETEKITHKASDAAEYIELFGSSAREFKVFATSLALRVIFVR